MAIVRKASPLITALLALLSWGCSDDLLGPSLSSFQGCDDVSGIRVGRIVHGELDTRDCDLNFDGLEITADVFVFEIDQTTDIEAFLQSDDFDALLVLYDADEPDFEDFIEFGDDVGSSSDALIRVSDLDRGKYVLVVTSYEGNELGDYSLELERR